MSRKRAKNRAPHRASSITQSPTPSTAPVETRAPVAPVDEVAASDEIAEQFFSAPPVTHPDEPVLLPEIAPERTPLVRSPGAAARRRDLTRYVTGAVAVCFMICVAAAVRAATVRGDGGTTPPALTYQASTPARAPELAEIAVPAPDTQTAAEAPPPSHVTAPSAGGAGGEAAGAKPVQAAAETVEKTYEPAPQPAASAVDEKPADPAAAREAKRLAQRALDRGDTAGSIEAGKRSVELDATDAETWLILGAAYLQRGAHREAREAFASCAHDATHGPRGECRALLR